MLLGSIAKWANGYSDILCLVFEKSFFEMGDSK